MQATLIFVFAVGTGTAPQQARATAPRPPDRAAVSFDTLTLVGEQWYGGSWGKLDSKGVQIPGTCGDAGSKPCTRGEPEVVMMDCPRSSAAILALSPTAVVSMANDTAQVSTDGGRSWSRYPGEDRADIYDPYIPAPTWLTGTAFMDVEPVDAYVPSCATPAGCVPASPVTAAADRVYLDWGLSSGGVPVRSFSYGRKQGANVWHVPAPVSFFSTSSCGGTQLPDGSFVHLAALQYTDPRSGPCCNNSVASFVSDDGLEWHYASTVASYEPSRVYQEGFSENDLVLLKDNRTLWSVIRSDSCDGEPSHRTLPFLTSRSTDRGRTWTPATPLPDDMLSATPAATVLPNGALLVSGGRPGVDLWVSADGLGDSWQRYSLPTVHNQQIATMGHLPEWSFCEPYLLVALNHTFAGDPTPRVDTAADGAPLSGWIASSGRVAVAALEHDVALVCYDRQGWGGGYYGVGLAPVFGPLGAWPFGRSAPPGCFLDISSVFCMRVTVKLE